MDTPIDTSNDFFVGYNGQTFAFVLDPNCGGRGMTPDQALRTAAWLSLMAEPFATHTFAEVREAIAAT